MSSNIKRNLVSDIIPSEQDQSGRYELNLPQIINSKKRHYDGNHLIVTSLRWQEVSEGEGNKAYPPSVLQLPTGKATDVPIACEWKAHVICDMELLQLKATSESFFCHFGKWKTKKRQM